jgi:hypothetical protein
MIYNCRMKTLKFKLYNHKLHRFLKRSINAAGVIYNHCIALHRRYYRMFKKHLNCAKLQAHIAKLPKRNPFWQSVGSQAVQDICQRIEKAYQIFFKHHNKGVRPGSSVLTAAHFSGKCQKSNARISKFIKFIKPKPHLFNSFNLVLIPSTIPLVVFDSKYPTIFPNHLLIVSAVFL